MPLLEIRDLTVTFGSGDAAVKAIDRLSLDISRGETVCLVGESGCGKSLTALSILGLVPKPAGKIAGGSIRFDGVDLGSLPEKELRKIRGRRIAMIFQEPMTSLNPVLTVGRQIGEVLEVHMGMSRRAARDRAVELLTKVGIPAPQTRVDEYPHQMSGGMRQRVMIAMALACGPDLLIADEPTTALDVTIQAQILDLIRSLKQESGMGTLLITHDMGVVAEMADRVAVMYAGRKAEEAPAGELFARPSHPYTRGLLSSVPHPDPATGSTKYLKRISTIPGSVPELKQLGTGCHFAGRCPLEEPRCRDGEPPLAPAGSAHRWACWVTQGAA
ncbi:MAG: ABC transporter ATP-binding protein [Deltaproteobacteria bacterium]|nr:ABC transporter ATP-binding protein [Deltaproteobacteria bacterium]